MGRTRALETPFHDFADHGRSARGSRRIVRVVSGRPARATSRPPWFPGGRPDRPDPLGHRRRAIARGALSPPERADRPATGHVTPRRSHFAASGLGGWFRLIG